MKQQHNAARCWHWHWHWSDACWPTPSIKSITTCSVCSGYCSAHHCQHSMDRSIDSCASTLKPWLVLHAVMVANSPSHHAGCIASSSSKTWALTIPSSSPTSPTLSLSSFCPPLPSREPSRSNAGAVAFERRVRASPHPPRLHIVPEETPASTGHTCTPVAAVIALH